MISDLDIWRAANLLICQHGAGTELEAAPFKTRCSTAAMARGGGVWVRDQAGDRNATAPRQGKPN
jgi:hypothetical protein